MSKTVTYELDLSNPPTLTAAQKAQLQFLARMPDSSIDLSDMPELPEAFWLNATANALYKPIKQSTTVRVDSDVLVWLKSQGKGYQTRINTILREAMLRSAQGKT